jgi:hypothetical protein
MSKNETTPVRMVDFTDFTCGSVRRWNVGFRCSHHDREEDNLRMDAPKKTFWFINRVRFSHETPLPIFADISIVKSSKKTNNVYPQYTIQDSGVSTNQEMYEIELEIDVRVSATARSITRSIVL